MLAIPVAIATTLCKVQIATYLAIAHNLSYIIHCSYIQGCKKAFKPGGPQRLYRIDLYGKKLIPVLWRNYKKWGGHGPHGPPGWHVYGYIIIVATLKLQQPDIQEIVFH